MVIMSVYLKPENTLCFNIKLHSKYNIFNNTYKIDQRALAPSEVVGINYSIYKGVSFTFILRHFTSTNYEFFI